MKLNPVTLKFSGSISHLEPSFFLDYTKNSLVHIRLALVLGCFFFAIFGVLDGILIPAQKHLTWAIRYGVVCPAILFVIYLTCIPKFHKYIQPILCFLILITGGGIVAMIIIAPPPISYSYYAGLILVFMFGYTLVRAQFIWATFAGWIVVLLYEGAAFFFQTPKPILINNNFFFVGANLTGMIACYSIEFYNRRAYYLNWLLLKEKEKVQAANQELEKRVVKRTKQLQTTNEELSHEIRDRKKSEAELIVKNLVFESAITANSISNQKGILTSVNKTFLKTWGYENKADVLGKPIAQFLKYEDQAKKIIFSLDETGSWEGEFTALKKGGSTFTAYGLATTIHDFSENITGYQSSVFDISDRKKMETEKVDAQRIAGEQEKLALVGQIAGKMAHDFNNILGIIMGHTEFALQECEDLETKGTFEVIFDQTIRGKNLTKNLIAFAKSSEPKQEYFSINEKINFVLKLLKNDLGNIEILKDELAEIEILADPGMIEHSLVNLLQNSIHATSLTINPRIIIRISSEENSVSLEIEDNGCGIPEEHIENIFAPSFSLKGSQDIHRKYKAGIKGTGYGMANVKKYIELHKGAISAESSLETGTKINIKLPLVRTELSQKELCEFQPINTFSGKYILLVEDEPAISDVQCKTLTQEPINHRVDIAPNGAIAMEMFKNNQYDLVSLDYMLPGKTNGMDIYLHIRKYNRSIPILFLSGNLEFLESIELLKQKDEYLQHLSKPCLSADYINGMNSLFERLSVSALTERDNSSAQVDK